MVSTGLVVTIVEGIARAAIKRADEMANQGEVSTDISMLATEEARSVTVAEETGSTNNVSELGLC